MYSPKPVPLFDLVAKAVNILGIKSGDIPLPVSFIEIQTVDFFSILLLLVSFFNKKNSYYSIFGKLQSIV